MVHPVFENQVIKKDIRDYFRNLDYCSYVDFWRMSVIINDSGVTTNPQVSASINRLKLRLSKPCV